jgi:hypothetical protein
VTHEDLRRAVQRAVAEKVRAEVPELFPPENTEPDGALPAPADLLPPDFPVAALAEKYGGTVKVSRGGVFRYAPDAPAYYDPETREILLNPDIDRVRVADAIRSRAWVRVPPEEVFCFVVLHEIGHASRAAHLTRRNGLMVPMTLAEKMETWEEDRAADSFAKANYFRWKIVRSR